MYRTACPVRGPFVALDRDRASRRRFVVGKNARTSRAIAPAPTTRRGPNIPLSERHRRVQHARTHHRGARHRSERSSRASRCVQATITLNHEVATWPTVTDFSWTDIRMSLTSYASRLPCSTHQSDAHDAPPILASHDVDSSSGSCARGCCPRLRRARCTRLPWR